MVQTNIGASVTIATVPEKYSQRIKQIGTADELQDRLAQLQQKLKRLFDFESEPRAVISQQVSELSARLKFWDLDQRYARIDMAFMKMGQKPQGWSCIVPKFAIFSLQSGTCKVKLTTNYDSYTQELKGVGVNSSPAVASELYDLRSFKQLHELNQSRLRKGTLLTSSIESKFAGAIPDEIRDQIALAKSQFSDVFLVCDAQWVFDMSVTAAPLPPPRPIDRDPLVIGKKDGKYWLVAKFDTTPAELYAASEFTY